METSNHPGSEETELINEERGDEDGVRPNEGERIKCVEFVFQKSFKLNKI